MHKYTKRAWMLLVFFILIFISFSNLVAYNVGIKLELDLEMVDQFDVLNSKVQDCTNQESQTFFPIGNEAVTFDNVSKIANLSGFRSDSYAWGDYNNDGYLDFLARGNLSIGTRLFKNSGPSNWTFSDVSEELNLTDNGSKPNRGYPIWGDYNNDGYLDFFVAGDSDQLWRNNGPPAWNFTNVTTEAGNLDDGRPSEAAAWGDYDKDGYIDLYVNSWYRSTTYYRDVLWHNNGDGTFTDLSSSAGIYDVESPGYRPPPYAGMAVSWGDYNNDGWLDIYVGKYHINPNSLFRNNHDGTFTDIAGSVGVAGELKYDDDSSGPYYGHTAGVGWADFNNNGNLDIWVSDLAHKDPPRWFCDDSQMLRNNGAPFFEFENIRDSIGIPTTPVGTTSGIYYKDEDFFGVTWGDYDNDCDLDFWVPQVKTYHSWAHSYLWRNNNNETFSDMSDNVGIKVWSNTGGVWGDYNNDGYLDLLTEGTHPYQGIRETHLFKNKGNSNNWLQLRLEGVISNKAAIGARIYLTCGDVTQTREIGGDAGGHAFQNSFTVEYGLGQSSTADEVKIIWPSGIVQVFEDIPANQIMNITEDITGPKISSVSASSYSADEDETITLTGVVEGSPADYEWDFDNDGTIDWLGMTAPPTTQHQYNLSGNYTAKLWIWNEQHDIGWMETTKFITINNVRPIADAGSDIDAIEDQLIMFDGSFSTDTPTDKLYLMYNWSFDDGTFSGWNESSTIHHSYADNGKYDVVLYVRDDDNAIASDIIPVNVKNHMPEIEIISNSTVAEDSEILFKAIGQDTVSDLPFIFYRWDFGDGNHSNWLREDLIRHSYTRNGTYMVTCSIRDDDWQKDENNTEVTILVYNEPPTCWVGPGANVEEDESVYLEGFGTDTVSDRSNLIYLWDFDDGSTSDWLYPGFQNITHIYTNQGIYSAKLIVKDNNNAECIGLVNITVDNVLPYCEVLEGSKQYLDVYEDETIAFSGSGYDTESDMPTLMYSWNFGVFGVPNSSWSGTPEFEYTYKNEGEYFATLTIKDDDGELNSNSIEIRVNNVEPKPKIILNSDEVNEDELIYFDGSESTDTESDLPFLNFTWIIKKNAGGKPLILLYGKKQQYTINKSGKYIVELELRDDNDITESILEYFEVKNIIPTAKIRSSTRKTEMGKNIIFSGVESSDTKSDEEHLLFSWDFGDNSIGSGEIVTHSYKSSGRYNVELTVTDDSGSSSTDQMIITISKSGTTEPSGSKSDSDSEASLVLAGIINIILIIILIILLFIYLKKRSKPEFDSSDHYGPDRKFTKTSSGFIPLKEIGSPSEVDSPQEYNPDLIDDAGDSESLDDETRTNSTVPNDIQTKRKNGLNIKKDQQVLTNQKEELPKLPPMKDDINEEKSHDDNTGDDGELEN